MDFEMTQVVTPEVVETEISEELGDALDRARQIVAEIKDEPSRDAAAKFGAFVATKERNLKTLREQKVTPLRKAYEGIRDLFDIKLRALDSVKRLIAQGISAWDVERERLRRLEKERIDREAREAREKYEREKRAWEIEQQRLKDEAERKECERQEEERRQREEVDRKVRAEEDARLRHAEEAQAQGNMRKIEPILEKVTPIAPAAPPVAAVAPQTPTPVPLPPPPPPAQVQAFIAKRPDVNTVSRDEWKWREDDLGELIKAVYEKRAPVEYLTFNKTEIGRDVRRLKGEFRCAGVKTWVERNTSFRSGLES